MPGSDSITFTHVVNPFNPYSTESQSEQLLTFEGLRRALAAAERAGVETELLGICRPEDAGCVQAPAKAVAALSRTINDVASPDSPSSRPLLVDLLQAAATRGTGEYLILTNMDIVPQPYFYELVQKMVQRWSAITVARRTIESSCMAPDDIEKLYAEAGRRHEGFDTFVFPRDWINCFDLDNICYGAAAFDKVLVANMDVVSGFKTAWFTRQYLTMHVGDEKRWQRDYWYKTYNRELAQKIYRRLIEKHGYPPRPSAFRHVYDRSQKRWRRSLERRRSLYFRLDKFGFTRERRVLSWTIAVRKQLGLPTSGLG